MLFTIEIPYYIYIHILNALPLGLEWSLDFEPLSHLKSFSHCNLWCKLLLLKHSCIVLLVGGAFLTNAFSNLLDANWGAKLYSQNKCLIQHQSVLFLLFFPSSSSCALYAYNSDINIFLLLILQTQLFLGFSIVFYSYSTLGPVLLFFLFNQISTVQVNKIMASYYKSVIWSFEYLIFLFLSIRISKYYTRSSNNAILAFVHNFKEESNSNDQIFKDLMYLYIDMT